MQKQFNTSEDYFQEKNERNRLVLSYLSQRGFFVPEIRRALLALNGIQVKDLAKAAGVSGAAVSNTLKGVRSNPDVKETVARLLGVEQEDSGRGNTKSGDLVPPCRPNLHLPG